MHEKGFTLIECLVALLIIAIVLASTTKAITLAINDVKQSYEREAANWIANNQFNSYRMLNTFPDLGNSDRKETMAGIQFIVRTKISPVPNPYFRKIEIDVSKENQPNYILFKTINFISQY